MKALKFVLLYLWQLPQNIIALLLYFFLKHWISTIVSSGFSTIYMVDKLLTNFTLGKYIFLGIDAPEENDDYIVGYTMISKVTGIFYIPLALLSSFIGNIIYIIRCIMYGKLLKDVNKYLFLRILSGYIGNLYK